MLIPYTKKETKYLKFVDGKFVYENDETREEYQGISGSITGITLRHHVFDNEHVNLWHLMISDDDDNYDVSFTPKSSTFISIVQFLASDHGLAGLDDVTISLYPRNAYTNVRIISHGATLDWCCDSIPGVKAIKINGQTISDDTDRMRHLDKLIKRINCHVSRKTGKEEGAE